jgi:protein-L-isoaspartate O-methyltransferase
MVEAAEVKSGDRVLEIGAGSGYAAAVLAQIAGRVHAIERHPALADAARQRFRKLGYSIELPIGDGTLGWPEAIGGRLVIPVGSAEGGQTLLRITRKAGCCCPSYRYPWCRCQD